MLLKNIRGLVGAFETPPPFVAGSDMSQFPVVEDAWLAVEAGRVVDWGEMSEFPGIADWSG
jgi:imidazolonepropionase